MAAQAGFLSPLSVSHTYCTVILRYYRCISPCVWRGVTVVIRARGRIDVHRRTWSIIVQSRPLNVQHLVTRPGCPKKVTRYKIRFWRSNATVIFVTINNRAGMHHHPCEKQTGRRKLGNHSIPGIVEVQGQLIVNDYYNVRHPFS